jgi:brefeldin A-resistance guanine nucleotide exchange factor 1
VSFSHQSANPSRDIRHSAINHFQRMLLSPQTLQGATPQQVYAVFEQAIFPLIQELLDEDVHLRDPHPQGIPETRMKASALLCRVFLYYHERLAADAEPFTQLWVQVLDCLNGLMHLDHRHQLVSPIVSFVRSFVWVNAFSYPLPATTGPSVPLSLNRFPRRT